MFSAASVTCWSLTAMLAAASVITPRASLTLNDLILEQAPTYVRPYIIRHYANANSVVIGSQVYRFPVTGPSSDYAFSLLFTSAPQSASYGVLPHIHERHFENFFTFKGRYQLWAQSNQTDDTAQQSRILTAGDYGAVPRNTTHTFQILDPDTEMLGVISPGGFEKLFYALGTNWSSSSHTPYVPSAASSSSAAGPPAAVLSTLESFDVYAQLDFAETDQAVNGAYPANSTWHDGANDLGETSSSPYFVANGWGPKYLNAKHGYQIVQPLVTGSQSADTNFTLSTISINGLRNGTSAGIPTHKFAAASAFTVLEGQLSIQIKGYPVATLEMGDVVFIPGNTAYTYYSVPAFTKVLYTSGGHDGLDATLIKNGRSWDFVTFPVA